MTDFETYQHDKKLLKVALVIASIVLTAFVALLIAGYTDLTTFLVGLAIAFVVSYIVCADIFSAFTDEDTFTNDIFFASFKGFTMPGVIFELDLDGIIWFITVKLLLSILSLALSVFWFALVVLFGSFVAFFTFPFAIYNLFSKKQ